MVDPLVLYTCLVSPRITHPYIGLDLNVILHFSEYPIIRRHRNITNLRFHSNFVIHGQHSTLVYLVSKASLIGKLARWTLLLQEYEFNIVH
jgi:hypothetical protein